ADDLRVGVVIDLLPRVHVADRDLEVSRRLRRQGEQAQRWKNRVIGRELHEVLKAPVGSWELRLHEVEVALRLPGRGDHGEFLSQNSGAWKREMARRRGAADGRADGARGGAGGTVVW